MSPKSPLEAPAARMPLPQPVRAAGSTRDSQRFPKAREAKTSKRPGLTSAVAALRASAAIGESEWTPLLLLAEAIVIVAPAAVLIAVLTYAAFWVA
jgi:hypothetical protein